MAIRTKDYSDQQAFDVMFHDLMLNRRTAMPAIIKKVNVSGGKLISVAVQPAIKQMVASLDGLSSSGNSLPIIENVPIVLPYSTTTGFSLTVPIKVGDECLLVIGDRSIDNWQDKGGEQIPVEPVTPRAHHLTDAFCIMGAVATPNAIDNYNLDAITIRNGNNNTTITLDNDEVVIKTATATVTVGSNIVCNVGASSVTIDEAKITLKAIDIELDGDVTITGELLDKNGINIESHFHSDPQGGNTGLPEN